MGGSLLRAIGGSLLDAIQQAEAASLLALAFENNDFAGIKNDANPASVIDYESNWLNYESSNGNFEDTGGVDRSLRIINDGSSAFTDPNVEVGSPAVESPKSTRGGSLSLGLLVMIILLQFANSLRYGNKSIHRYNT